MTKDKSWSKKTRYKAYRFLRASSSVVQEFCSSVIEEQQQGFNQTYSSDTFPQRRRKRKRLEGFQIPHLQQQQQTHILQQYIQF
jgi:hypothetical protein